MSAKSHRFKIFGRGRFRYITGADVRVAALTMQSQGTEITQNSWPQNTVWGGMCALFTISNSHNHRRRLRDIYNEVLQEWEAQGMPPEEHISELELEESDDDQAEQLPPETQSHDLENSHQEDKEEEGLPQGVEDVIHLISTDDEVEQLEKKTPDLENSHQEDKEEEGLPQGVEEVIHLISTDDEVEQLEKKTPDLENSHQEDKEEEGLPQGVEEVIHLISTDDEVEQLEKKTPDLENSHQEDKEEEGLPQGVEDVIHLISTDDEVEQLEKKTPDLENSHQEDKEEEGLPQGVEEVIHLISTDDEVEQLEKKTPDLENSHQEDKEEEGLPQGVEDVIHLISTDDEVEQLEKKTPDLENSHQEDKEEEGLPQGVEDVIHLISTDDEVEQLEKKTPDLENSHQEDKEEEGLPQGVEEVIHLISTDDEVEQLEKKTPDLENSHQEDKEEEGLPQGVEEVIHLISTDDEVEQLEKNTPDLEKTMPQNSPPQQQEKLYCLCRQPNDENEPYVECFKCKDWFHPFCVGARSYEDLECISPWFCPNCSTLPPKKPKKAARRLFIPKQQDSTSSSEEDSIDMEVCDRDERIEDTDSNTSSPEVCRGSDSTDEGYPECYQITFSRAEWEDIKPVATEKGKSGHLVGAWCDVFAQKMSTISDCVLVFKRNRRKTQGSRKTRGPFWHGTAHCKFANCRTFKMIIVEDPGTHNDNIIVEIQVSGTDNHNNALCHRRHTRKPEREKIRKELGEFTPTHIHTKKMASANKEKLLSGNYDQVPSIPVLQKISSEKNLQDRYHENPFLDISLVQQAMDSRSESTALRHHYVQFIGMSPLNVHMYSVPQLQALKQQIDKKRLCLYLDATGTVVAKPPETKNVLYYALCMPLESPQPTVVPLAEMITSDQTSVNIQNWLNCLCRDYTSTFKKEFTPTKVETDFSWAIIHATLASLSKCTIHQYLQRCMEVCQSTEPCTFTIVHVCAAHMMKIVADKASKVKCSKDTKSLFLHAFALVQNSSNIKEIQMLLYMIFNVFSLRTMNSACSSINELQQAIQKQGFSDEVKAALDTAGVHDDMGKIDEKTPKGIVRNSPFTRLFKDVLTLQEDNKSEEDCGLPTNPHFCPDLLKILKPYVGTLPLWSGLMLDHLGLTRDTNAYAENWFRTTKHVILRDKLHRRPGQFIQVMEEFVLGRLKGSEIHSVRQARVDNDEVMGDPTEQPLTQQEKWQKRGKKTKSKYFNPPNVLPNIGMTNTCPPWSGEGTMDKKCITMTNTCTIDNLLYIFHLVLSTHPDVLGQVEDASTDDWLQALLQVHQEFLGKRWGQGKVAWLKNLQQFQNSTVWDCFGTEHHFVVSRLSTLQLMREITTCAEEHCTFPRLWKNKTVIEVVCKNFTGLQESLDKWFHHPPKTCNLINKNGLPCQGQRNIVRQEFTIGRPTLLVLRFLSVQTTRGNKQIWPNQLPENVNILGEGYIPIGMTYHQNKSAHFVGFHRVGNQGWHYYDGMKETSKPGSGVVRVNDAQVRRLMLKSWIPGHLVLVAKQNERDGVDCHMEV